MLRPTKRCSPIKGRAKAPRQQRRRFAASAARARSAFPSAIRQIFEKAESPPAYQDAVAFKAFVEAQSARPIAATRKIGKVE
jgi:hypothetical protein